MSALVGVMVFWERQGVDVWIEGGRSVVDEEDSVVVEKQF